MKCPLQWQDSPLTYKSVLGFLLPILSLFSSDCVAAAQKVLDLTRLPPAAAIATDFARDIQPLFAERCVKCHGSEKQKGGLRLNSKIDALKGGDDGKVIVPGNSSESRANSHW